MRIGIEGESRFSEVGILEHEGEVVCREYLVEREGVIFDLTAGAQGYVDSLIALNPEFAAEPILIVDGATLARAESAIGHISTVPDLGKYLIEQTPPALE